MDFLKNLIKQPYWVVTLLAGVFLVGLSTVSLGKDVYWTTHGPNSRLLVSIGIALIVVSIAAFGFNLWLQTAPKQADGKGVDLTRVKEEDDIFWTTVSGCEIRVVSGRIEQYEPEPGAAVVLPCNEYFDDRCVGDTSSALGAYVNRAFEGQVEDFVILTKSECRRRFGQGTSQRKTNDETAESFGAGRCLLLVKPFGRSVPIALVSTTTQRAGEGLAARISYLFYGMRELGERLADERITRVVMPILGSGHGKIDPPLALVGLLLAVAEAARYGKGGQRLHRVTIVVFREDADSPHSVDPLVIRRALALIGDA